MAQEVCRVCLDLQERKEKVDMLDQWVPLEQEVQGVLWDPTVVMVPQEIRVALDSRELWERRERLEKQEIQDNLEN